MSKAIVPNSSQKQQETLLALMTSKTNREAAKALGITERGLYKRVKKWDLDKLIKEIQTHSIRMITLASLKAIKVLIDNLDSDDPRVQIVAAKEILDRAGLTERTSAPGIPILGGISSDMNVTFVKDNRLIDK